MNMSACLPCYSTSRFIQRWCCLQSLELFVWTCTVFLVWRIRNTFEWVGGWEGGGDYSLILTFHLLTWGNLWVGSFHSLPAADLLTFTFIHLSFQTKKNTIDAEVSTRDCSESLWFTSCWHSDSYSIYFTSGRRYLLQTLHRPAALVSLQSDCMCHCAWVTQLCLEFFLFFIGSFNNVPDLLHIVPCVCACNEKDSLFAPSYWWCLVIRIMALTSCGV